MKTFDELFLDVCDYSTGYVTEASLSPLKKFVGIIEDIKNNRPNKFDSNEDIKKFVDKNYDDIMKASETLENESKELDKNALKYLIRMCLELIAYMAILVSGNINLAFLALLVFYVDMIVTAIANTVRQKDDREAYNNLLKIRTSLKKLQGKKLPKNVEKKIDIMVSKIDDVEEEFGRRARVTTEAVDEIKLSIFESCHNGEITEEERDNLLSILV